jgi:hypothetical protein
MDVATEDIHDYELKGRFEALFDDVGLHGDFACAGCLPCAITEGPQVVVDGVGKLNYPVDADQFSALQAVSVGAPIGNGLDTVGTSAVRTIGPEIIPSSTVNEMVVELVDAACCKMGVRGQIVAKFHQMQLHAPGAHSLSHKPTEKQKDAGIIGTLLLQLPAGHEGGILTVRNDGKTMIHNFGGPESSTHFQFASFFEDCEHDMSVVTSGHRIVLVYHLVRSDSTSGVRCASSLPKSGLEQRFNALVTLWETRLSYTPDLLALPLTYGYKEALSSFADLKGKDIARVKLITDCDKLCVFLTFATRESYGRSFRMDSTFSARAEAEEYRHYRIKRRRVGASLSCRYVFCTDDDSDEGCDTDVDKRARREKREAEEQERMAAADAADLNERIYHQELGDEEQWYAKPRAEVVRKVVEHTSTFPEPPHSKVVTLSAADIEPKPPTHGGMSICEEVTRHSPLIGQDSSPGPVFELNFQQDCDDSQDAIGDSFRKEPDESFFDESWNANQQRPDMTYIFHRALVVFYPKSFKMKILLREGAEKALAFVTEQAESGWNDGAMQTLTAFISGMQWFASSGAFQAAGYERHCIEALHLLVNGLSDTTTAAFLPMAVQLLDLISSPPPVTPLITLATTYSEASSMFKALSVLLNRNASDFPWCKSFLEGLPIELMHKYENIVLGESPSRLQWMPLPETLCRYVWTHSGEAVDALVLESARTAVSEFLLEVCDNNPGSLLSECYVHLLSHPSNQRNKQRQSTTTAFDLLRDAPAELRQRGVEALLKNTRAFEDLLLIAELVWRPNEDMDAATLERFRTTFAHGVEGFMGLKTGLTLTARLAKIHTLPVAAQQGAKAALIKAAMHELPTSVSEGEVMQVASLLWDESAPMDTSLLRAEFVATIVPKASLVWGNQLLKSPMIRKAIGEGEMHATILCNARIKQLRATGAGTPIPIMSWNMPKAVTPYPEITAFLHGPLQTLVVNNTEMGGSSVLGDRWAYDFMANGTGCAYSVTATVSGAGRKSVCHITKTTKYYDAGVRPQIELNEQLSFCQSLLPVQATNASFLPTVEIALPPVRSIEAKR